MKRIIIILSVLFLHVISMTAGNDFVLVIDAGHGGHDAGAVGRYSKEKNINLAVALAFGRYVEQNCKDVKVIYTRKKDVFVPLHERANIANRNHANAFISIHTNALPGRRIARGMETYTMGMRRSDEKLSAAQRENSVITYEDNYEQHYAGYDPNSPESMIMFEFIHDKNMEKSVELAQLVQKNVCSLAQRQNKGVKQDAFLVLRETSMPACLIELGFISTPDEEDALNNKRTIDRMAYGIYTAFAKFKDKNAPIAPYMVQVEEGSAVSENSTDEPPAKRENPGDTVLDRVVTDTEIAEQRAANQQEAPVFCVQFLTGPRVLPEGSRQFKGLKNVTHYKEGPVVKFVIGEFDTFAKANAKKREVASLFPDAFVVALQNGVRIDINEARNWHR